MNKIILKVKINYPERINFSSFYHPFRCETKSFYMDHVEDELEADIIYNNIYDYSDNPTSAYENKDLILIPHPLYGKKVNDEYNIVVVPLVMHEQDKIIFDKTFLSECRKNNKKYEYGYIGDIYKGRLELKDLELDSYFFKDTSNDTIWQLNEIDRVERLKDFLNEVSLSKFTFCPRGNGSSSFRLFESLEAGSVPLITGMVDYPFRDKVDWDSFSIRGESIENLPELIDKSKNLTDKEYEVMRQNGIDFWEQYCRLDNYHDWVIKEFLL